MRDGAHVRRNSLPSFVQQQPALDALVRAAAMMRESAYARGRNDAMAGNCERQSVISARLADRTRLAIQSARKLTIRSVEPGGMRGDLIPDRR